ncbi:hypothetical protein HHK36_006382 [Tetracentron sinense]|uniref:Elongator complex protein 2 n=1 Tax=Tetracentron sinense TaxID=13715 RepID=A0A834ZH39_TETSI|nr:hypothetical protein HHK36_006382 [Tetracentron sinense]
MSSPLSSSLSQGRYPCPSNINVAKFVSFKLLQANYLLWKTQILSLIESQDLFGFINGETPMPDEEIESPDGKGSILNPDFKSWTRTDRLLKAWIISTLSEEVLGLAVGLVTSRDVWDALENSFAQDSQAREFELTQQLQLFKKEGLPSNGQERNHHRVILTEASPFFPSLNPYSDEAMNSGGGGVEVERAFIGAGCNRIVNSVSFGACDLVAFGSQNAVAIFCPKTAQILTTLPGHKAVVNCTQWLPSNKYAFKAKQLEKHFLLSGDAEGIIILWELSLKDGKWKHVLQVPQPHKKGVTCITGIMVSQTYAIFASTSSDSTVYVWEMILPSIVGGKSNVSLYGFDSLADHSY